MFFNLREQTEKERRKEEERRKNEEAESAFQWWLEKKEEERRERQSVNKQVSYLCSTVPISLVSSNCTYCDLMG